MGDQENLNVHEFAGADEQEAYAALAGILSDNNDADEAEAQAAEESDQQITEVAEENSGADQDELEAQDEDSSVEEEQETEDSKTEAEDGEDAEDGGVEIPDDWSAFSEALEVDPDELLAHVKVDVGGKKMALSEVIEQSKGGAEYQSKLSELQEQNQYILGRAQEASTQWKQQFDALEDAANVLAARLQRNGKDLNQILEEEGSEAYLRAKADQEEDLRALQKVQQMRQQKAAQSESEIQAFRAEQARKLAHAMPDMADPAKAEAFTAEMANAMQTHYKLSQDEVDAYINGPWDHRHILMISDAMKYRALEQGKKETVKKLKGKPKLIKPGATKGKQQQKADKEVALKKKLRATGSVDVAAALIADLL